MKKVIVFSVGLLLISGYVAPASRFAKVVGLLPRVAAGLAVARMSKSVHYAFVENAPAILSVIGTEDFSRFIVVGSDHATAMRECDELQKRVASYEAAPYEGNLLLVAQLLKHMAGLPGIYGRITAAERVAALTDPALRRQELGLCINPALLDEVFTLAVKAGTTTRYNWMSSPERAQMIKGLRTL